VALSRLGSWRQEAHGESAAPHTLASRLHYRRAPPALAYVDMFPLRPRPLAGSCLPGHLEPRRPPRRKNRRLVYDWLVARAAETISPTATPCEYLCARLHACTPARRAVASRTSVAHGFPPTDQVLPLKHFPAASTLIATLSEICTASLASPTATRSRRRRKQVVRSVQLVRSRV
jgi:hypothetical protein